MDHIFLDGNLYNGYCQREKEKRFSGIPKLGIYSLLTYQPMIYRGSIRRPADAFLFFDVLFFLQPSGRFSPELCKFFAILIFVPRLIHHCRHSLDGSVISSCYLTFAVLPLIYSAESTAKNRERQGKSVFSRFLRRGIEREFRFFLLAV